MNGQPPEQMKWILRPVIQAGGVGILIVLLTLVDKVMPHNTELLKPGASTWIMASGLVLFFVILNPIVTLRMKSVSRYFPTSIVCYIGLLIFGYAWCYLITGKHIDDTGSFRWIWIVLTIAFLVFHLIARAMRRIVDIAMRLDR